MSGYDYGNARLRAMRSRLLSRRELETLADVNNLQGLIAALTRTNYQQPIESALTRFTGMDCIDDALHNDLINTIGKINTFYHEETGNIIALVLRAYDIYNLKTILRGLSKKVPSGEIISTLLPVGDLKINSLHELARLNDPREAIDHMASQSIAFSAPLLKLRAEHPGAEIFEMELALDRWHVHEIRRRLRGEETETPLAYALSLDIDIANLLTVLRFVHEPHERNVIRDKLGVDDLTPIFIQGGRIPFETLSTAVMQDMLSSAVESFAGTPFESALRTGMEVYSGSNRLSDIEKRLRRYRLEQLAKLIQKDPLGLGVVLGYIALKVNEIANIRWIAQGINMDIATESIHAELETVP